MKISKVENLENTEPIQNDYLDDLDNENIQLGINKPKVLLKKELTENRGCAGDFVPAIDAVEKKKRIYKKRLLSQTLKSPQ
jgi:hypothetical protein